MRIKLKLLQVKKEKANELFTTIGYQLSQTTSAICFDDSIAYSIPNSSAPTSFQPCKIIPAKEAGIVMNV